MRNFEFIIRNYSEPTGLVQNYQDGENYTDYVEILVHKNGTSTKSLLSARWWPYLVLRCDSFYE